MTARLNQIKFEKTFDVKTNKYTITVFQILDNGNLSMIGINYFDTDEEAQKALEDLLYTSSL